MSFLSDSSDEDAVEDVLNQAMDHSILDQIAKINCSSDSVLPTHLENRFSKLKSFPLSNPTSNFSNPHLILGDSKVLVNNTDCDQKPVEETQSKMSLRSEYFRSNSSTKYPKGKGLRMKLASSSPSYSSNSSTGSAIGSPHSGENKVVKSKSRSNSYNLSQSPKKSGCFWCSLKWGFGKNRNGEDSSSDSSIFSEKKQHKLLEKVLKEEDQINREAEKIVNLVKQASARINISDLR